MRRTFFKLNYQAQVCIEYLVIFALIASITLLSLCNLLDDTEPKSVQASGKLVFDKIADRIIDGDY